jgi:hypothetical protein
MEDKIIKSKISFKELPREVRKGYLISGTNHYRETMKLEPHKFTFRNDYKYYSWLVYYGEDYKYNLCQNAYTKKFYCEVAE